MASEIRVNQLTNRAGLGTITFANGGVQFSGITTFANGEFYVGTGATIINPSSNEFNFHTGGSNRFTINNSGVNIPTLTATTGTFSGNVSVGGVLTYEDVKNVDAIGIITARDNVHIAQWIAHIGDLNTTIGFPSNDTITLNTSSNERLRIDSSGNVIVNNTTATAGSYTYKLLASDQITSSEQTFGIQYAGTVTYGLNAESNSDFTIKKDGTERLRIASDGKVAIGGNYANTGTFGRQVLIDGTLGLNNDSGTVGMAFHKGSANTYGYMGTGDWAVTGGATEDFGIAAKGNLIFGTSSGGWAEKLRIDSSGRILKGITSARGNFANNTSGVEYGFQIEGTSAILAGLSIIRNSNDENDGGITLGKTRATSTGGNTVVQAGDDLGTITWAGSDGTTLQFGAEMLAEVQSGVGNDDMPTDLIFKTNGGSTSTTERLRIDSSGNVTIKDAKQLLFENDANNASSAILNLGASGTSNLVFATGGAERLRITSAGHLLLSKTTSNWGTSTDNTVIQLENSAIWDYAGVQFDVGHNYYYNGSAYKYIRGGYAARQTFHNNTGDIAFWSGGTGSADATFTWSEKLRIKSNGDVGIGIDNPTARLHTTTAYNKTGAIITGGGVGYNNSLEVNNANGARVFTVDGGGKIGVNMTPSADAQFCIKNSDDSNYNVLDVYNDNGNKMGGFSQDSTGNGTVGARTNGGDLNVMLRSSGDSYFKGGRLLIGTDAHSISSSEMLEVKHPSTGFSYFENDNTSGYAPIYINNKGSNSGFAPIITITDGSGNRGGIGLNSSETLRVHGQGGVEMYTGGTMGGGTQHWRINNLGDLTHTFAGRHGHTIGSTDGSGAYLMLDGAEGNPLSSGTDYMYMEHTSSGNFDMWNGNGSVSTTKFMEVSPAGYIRNPKQPSFAAYRAQSSWNVSSGAEMVFNATRHNIGSHYSTSNGRFTAPVSGSYLFTFFIIYQGNFNSAYVRMYKNGSRQYGSDIHFTHADNNGHWDNIAYSQIFYLAANDYVSMYNGNHTSGFHGNHWMQFCGYLLG